MGCRSAMGLRLKTWLCTIVQLSLACHTTLSTSFIETLQRRPIQRLTLTNCLSNRSTNRRPISDVFPMRPPPAACRCSRLGPRAWPDHPRGWRGPSPRTAGMAEVPIQSQTSPRVHTKTPEGSAAPPGRRGWASTCVPQDEPPPTQGSLPSAD